MFSIEEIKRSVESGAEIEIEGFAQTVRCQGKIAFVVIRSRLSTVQGVAWAPDLVAAMKACVPESRVRCRGAAVFSSQAPDGVEIKLSSFEVISPSLPLPVAKDSESSLLQARPAARLRFAEQMLPLLVSAAFEEGLREALNKEGFVEIHTPKLMGSPSESGAEVFTVPYFGDTAYLAQSPQFYKQMGIIGGLERLFEIGPVFRAEPSLTTRHATEFTSIDVELAGVVAEEELVAWEYALLTAGLTKVMARWAPEVERLFPVASLPAAPVVLTHAEAMVILGAPRGSAMNAQMERELGAHFTKQGQDLVAIVAVPWSQRPFYHRRRKEEQGLTHSFELLYRGTEITTGAIREHRPAVLRAQLALKGMSGRGAEGYLESFDWGAPPHGGFGLGLARLVALFLGLPSIREAQMLTRTPKSVIP